MHKSKLNDLQKESARERELNRDRETEREMKGGRECLQKEREREMKRGREGLQKEREREREKCDTVVPLASLFRVKKSYPRSKEAFTTAGLGVSRPAPSCVALKSGCKICFLRRMLVRTS